eukprot:PhF_6_TR14890/c0_g1_i2/m.23220
MCLKVTMLVLDVYSTQVNKLRQNVQQDSENMRVQIAKHADAVSEIEKELSSTKASLEFVIASRDQCLAEINTFKEEKRKFADQTTAAVEQGKNSMKETLREELAELHQMFHNSRVRRTDIHTTLENCMTKLGIEFTPIQVKPEP